MRASLFKKYLLMSSLVMLISFVLIGGVLFFAVSNYWTGEKMDDLAASAHSVSSLVSQMTDHEEGRYAIQASTRTLLTAVSLSNGADIFVTDTEGKVLLVSESMDRYPYSEKRFEEALQTIERHGKYAALSTLNDLYPDNQYAVGVPLVYTENGTDHTYGAVFIASSARSFTAFRRDLVRMCIISILFAAVISLLISGAMTYQMVLPLKEMSVAAVSLGNGDFSRRVRVRSQDEMGELATAFNNMAASLASSEAMNRSFIANVSHELKTPMTTIAGFIDGVLDGTIPRERQDDYLRIVSSEVKRLSRLVKSMLALSRIDSGEMKLRCVPFNIKETVIDTLFSYENLINQRGISVEGLEDCEDVTLNGDPDMIHQVVYNLVENAVKFVNDNGTITVGIAEKNGTAAVRIRNTGAGIAPEEQPMIFDRFYKTDKSRCHDKNGMGLGLYIVKTILQLHGGSIVVRSAVNEFCEFEFYLPVNAVQNAQPVQTTAH